MKRTPGIIVVAIALASCLFAFGCAGDQGSAGNAITVSATSQAQIAPDKAAFTITVAGSGDTADAAVNAAKSTADNVMAHLKTIGVAEDKMKAQNPETTERFGEAVVVQEAFGGYEDEWGNWVEEGVNEYFVDNTGNVVGYDATMKVQVSEFNATSFGQVVREAKAAGATAIGSVSFTIGDREAAYQQALSEAVNAAHAKAESLAKASSVYVGRLVNLVENPAADFATTVEAESSSLNLNDESTFDVSPATIPVEASVTASYAIS